MKKTIVVLLCLLVSNLFAIDSLYVNGRVTVDSVALSGVHIADVESDLNGYFSFSMPAGSDTSFAPSYQHFLFEPAQITIHPQDTVMDSINIYAFRQIKKTLVISGQSNTNSNGTYQYFIPDSVDKEIPYYLAFRGVEHGLATLGLISKFGVYDWNNFGIETPLARTIYKNHEDSLAVMKIGWGGTSLILNWGERGETWTWFKEMHMHAVDSMRAVGYEPKYIGFFWYQGESDRTLDRSTVYADSLYRFVGRVRELFPNGSEVDSLPFVCVRILWNPANTYEEAVRQAQMNIVDHRAFTAWVDIDDCDPYRISETNLHYNGIALNRIGYKLAAAYLDLVGHPVDSSATVTVDLDGEIDSTIMIFGEGDMTFYDKITASSYQFPAKLGDSLSLKLLLPTQDYISDPETMTIPFVYDPSVILDGAYTFNVDIKTGISSYKDDMRFLICEARPNPFNPSTRIHIDLPGSNDVELVIYDLQGKEVATLINGFMEMGHYDLEWNAEAFPSGVYIASLTAGEKRVFQKLTLLK